LQNQSRLLINNLNKRPAMNYKWTFNATDREMAKELSGFLPEKILDFHAHIYRSGDLKISSPSVWTGGPAEVSVDTWRQHLGKFMDDKKLTGALFFPAPAPGADLKSENSYLVSLVKNEGSSRGLVIVSPDYPREELASLLDLPCVAGIKPYHYYSTEHPTLDSSVKGFLPEWQIEMAASHHSIVMMHLVKSRAIADVSNQNDIRGICKGYPNIKLILAHAARCFHYPDARNGIGRLRGLENIWFDLSGICEPEAILTILREFGPRKLLWGSDFPISQLRGKCVTLGDGFIWLDNGLIDWQKSRFASPVLTGIESLMALKTAAEEFGLNRDDISDIFYNNAERLLFREERSDDLTQKLYRHAKEIIPGGVQLLSKRPENMAPDRWPPYFREARGCEVWDLDGKHYFDMVSNGIGACLLGFSDPDVNSAVRRRVNLGSMSSLNPPEEVELADLLCGVHPWAEQVRFTRCGGETCAVAVRIARATTDRSVVAVCGYHGWHDWYLAANLGESDALRGHLLPGLDPMGVPVELRGTTLTFRYNDRENFQKIIDDFGPRLAAVIMEPCRNSDPEPGFLEYVRDETHRCGALLIFDEITIGWRLHFGGSHLRLGCIPDIAVFAKALGNGYPIGAIIGTKAAMDGAHSSFISSTYWTESIGPAAAVATLKKMRTKDIPSHVARIGERIMKNWSTLGKKNNLPVNTEGYPCLAHFSFQHEDSEKLRTIYTGMMLERGFLAGLSIYPTLAHNDEIVNLYGEAVDEVFGAISKELHNGSIDRLLKGRVALSGFVRLTN
jgi:glutamate-1-semialdehyde 2,1-aminomutase